MFCQNYPGILGSIHFLAGGGGGGGGGTEV
jgi:hypothetical protein